MDKDSIIHSYGMPKYKDRKRRKEENCKMKIPFVGGQVAGIALVVSHTW